MKMQDFHKTNSYELTNLLVDTFKTHAISKDNNMVTNENGGEHEESVILNKMEEDDLRDDSHTESHMEEDAKPQAVHSDPQCEEIPAETVQSSLPAGRVKRIIKLDKEINKINADALFVISNATELFVKLLAEKSSEVAVEKKRKTINLEHLRIAVKRHQPTAAFLLDSLPMLAPAVQTSSKPDRPPKSSDKNSVPVGSRRIDSFFQKGP
ncbi:hypothetical protein LXL04_019842 [Taraxacum kok-saghyz]